MYNDPLVAVIPPPSAQQRAELWIWATLLTLFIAALLSAAFAFLQNHRTGVSWIHQVSHQPSHPSWILEQSRTIDPYQEEEAAYPYPPQLDPAPVNLTIHPHSDSTTAIIRMIERLVIHTHGRLVSLPSEAGTHASMKRSPYHPSFRISPQAYQSLVTLSHANPEDSWTFHDWTLTVPAEPTATHQEPTVYVDVNIAPSGNWPKTPSILLLTLFAISCIGCGASIIRLAHLAYYFL